MMRRHDINAVMMFEGFRSTSSILGMDIHSFFIPWGVILSFIAIAGLLIL